MASFQQFGSNFQQGFSAKAFFAKHDISPSTQAFLLQVYGLLAATVASAAVGIYLSSALYMNGMSAFVLLGLVIWLGMTPATQENAPQRIMMLMGIGLLKGANLGPLVHMYLHTNPAIVSQAFIATTLLFACFSGSAYFSQRRSYMYLGGMLGSALSMMFWLSIASIFFPTNMGFNVLLYGGLLVFCGYVIYDTQLIIERAEMGMKDPVRGALDLFLDFAAIFVRLLIILQKMQKKDDDRRRR